MTDDLNRLRAVTLTDEERAQIDKALRATWRDNYSHSSVIDGLVPAVESIVAARTAALLDRAERAEAQLGKAHRDNQRLSLQIRESFADLAALRASVTNLADEWADQPDDWDEDTQQQIADGKRLRSLLAAAPTETEGTPDE